MQAALNAFQAENFGDFVGQLSSFCVAGLESETVSTREVNLKRLVEGLSSPEGVPKADTAPAGDDQSSNSTQQEEQAVEGDVEGDAEDEERERQVGAGWDANVLSDTGWRIGLNGRKVYIEFELFNIFSPTGMFRDYIAECESPSSSSSVSGSTLGMHSPFAVNMAPKLKLLLY